MTNPSHHNRTHDVTAHQVQFATAPGDDEDTPRWWQRGVIYQVYPRSFMDGDGDGIGDLAGIRRRLDYFTWLGVDAIWISPIYPSPMADFGYDVSDYTAIDPAFGTMDEFDALVRDAHAAGLRVLLDFVPNHTSVEHPWFREARRSRDDPRRDWYIWRDPAPDGGPPNNWRSMFGGSAWALDQATGQYYYHAYLQEQPDLNWRNADVRAAMHDVLRFWLARGVDGFRVDVIWHLVKDDRFRDNPPNPAFHAGQSPYWELLATHTTDRPEVHDVIAEMRAVLDEYPDRMMVGEVYLPIDRLVTYYGAGGRGVHLPFNFQLISLPWRAQAIAAAIADYERALPHGGWPNWVLGNHDKPRIARRVGAAQSRVAAMLLLTLRGTPTMYYGDELGIADVPIPPAAVHDPWEKREPGLGLGRDPVRTPMQWDATPGAGFTTGSPWLPLSDDAASRNVAAQRNEPASILTLYRRLLELRRLEAALSLGAYAEHHVVGDVLAYVRTRGADRLLVALNFGPVEATVPLPTDTAAAQLLLSTALDRDGTVTAGPIRLRPDEGVIVRCR